MKEIEILMRTVAMASLMLCCTSAFAGPTFESVTFGAQSIRCDESNTSRAIVLDGRGASVFFNKLRAKVSEKNPAHDAARCDVTLKLSAPLEAPVVIQFDVRGDFWVTGNGTTTAFVTMLGRKEVLNFHPLDDAGVQRFSAKLPKGAQQLDFSIEIAASGKHPDSTALIFVDALDIGFEWRK